jgi:hypothetical protein
MIEPKPREFNNRRSSNEFIIETKGSSVNNIYLVNMTVLKASGVTQLCCAIVVQTRLGPTARPSNSNGGICIRTEFDIRQIGPAARPNSIFVNREVSDIHLPSFGVDREIPSKRGEKQLDRETRCGRVARSSADHLST